MSPPHPVGSPRDGVDNEGRDLLIRHRSGDHAAFERLVECYRASVYGYLVRSGVEAEDRDDLFQEIFIRVHRASPRFDGERPLRPWLFTIACNAVRTYHRRRRVHEIVGEAALAPIPRSELPDGERSAASRETVAWLETEIPRLPAAQREVLQGSVTIAPCDRDGDLRTAIAPC